MKPVASLSAFALTIGGIFLGQSLQAPQAEAATPGLASTGWNPGWTTVPGLEADWLQSLNKDSVYWTSDWSTGEPGAAVGNTVTMLGESYDFNADATQFQTRPVMQFRRTAPGPAAFIDFRQFSTQAIAPIGGVDSGNELSMYFWSHDGADLVNTSILDCNAVTGRPANEWISVVRVTNGDSKIQVGCMPAPSMAPTYPPAPTGYGYATGGEGDQLTGLIYIQSDYSSLDNQPASSTAPNSTHVVQFTIWDPVTGKFSSSGPVQPADTRGAGFSLERVRLFAITNGTTCVTGYESGCTYGTPTPDFGDGVSVETAADFALDAQGNIYIYSAKPILTTDNGAAAIVRIAPARGPDGMFLNGSSAAPWVYNVVTKLTKSDPTIYDPQSAIWSVGTGIHNGKFLAGGYIDVTSATYPAAAGASVSTTASRMLRLDPLSGDIAISASTANQPASDSLHGANYDMSTLLGRIYRDNASAQMLTVVGGTVYNDVNADGVISAGEPGAAGVRIAVYDEADELVGTQVTAQDGSYRLIVSGNGKYSVRLTQPQINGANAVQTWGGVEGTLNDVTIHCVDGDITSGSGACAGAKASPYVDPAIGAINEHSDPATWPVYASVQMNGDSELAIVNFGITTRASYGDAGAGPASLAEGAPIHLQGQPATLWMGDTLGTYDGPATDNAAHNATDDGVFIAAYGGDIPLQGDALAATGQYQLAANLSGASASAATVTGWTPGIGATSWTASNSAVKWAPTTTAGTSGARATGTLQLQTTGAVSGTPTVQLRTQGSLVATMLPTNATNEYQAAPGSSTGNWSTPGEIEDYTFTAGDAVYRPAATTSGGSVTVTVDGQTLNANPAPAVAYGVGKAVSANQAKTVTATVPNASWSVGAITVKDTKTGDDLTSARGGQLSADGMGLTFTPQMGDDLTIEVRYDRAVDETKSTLVVDTPQSAGTNMNATVTIVDAEGTPLAGRTVSFSKVSDQINFVGGVSTCTTDADGVCSIQITSTVAAKYPKELSASVTKNGSAVQVSGSPADVEFTANDGDPAHSTLTVAPAGPLTVDDEANRTYTATTEVRDSNDNLSPNQTVTYTVEQVNPDGSVKAIDPARTFVEPDLTCTTSAEGTCSITIESIEAGDFVIHAQIPNDQGALTDVQQSPKTVTFKPGKGDPNPPKDSCGDKTPTNLRATSPVAVGGNSTATAYITDKYCNAVGAGTTVSFTVDMSGKFNNGPAGVSASGQSASVVTDADSNAIVYVTDDTAETVNVSAALGSTNIADGSPAEVVFTPGTVSVKDSSFEVSPVADPNKSDTWVKVGAPDGDQFYTGTLTLRDEKKNPLPGQDLTKIAMEASSQYVDVTDVVDNGDGTYTVKFTSKVALSDATASAAWDGQQVGSDKPIPFAAGVVSFTCEDATNSGRVCSNLSVAPASLPIGEKAVATAYLADEYANPVTTATPVTFGLTSPSGDAVMSSTDQPLAVTVPVNTGAGGKAIVEITDMTAEVVEVSARIDLGALPGSPKSVEFTATGFSWENSLFQVTPTITDLTDQTNWIVADGQTSYTGTLTAKDTGGNLLKNLDLADIAFAASSADVTVSSPVINHNDGTYTVTYSSTKASATPTASVAYQGRQVGENLPIPFKGGALCLDPQDPDAATYAVSVTGDPAATQALADGKASWTGTVNATDCFGNVLTNLKPADFHFTAADGVTTSPDVVSDGQGKYSVTYTSTTPGTYATNVTYQDIATKIKPGDLEITFNNPGPCFGSDCPTPSGVKVIKDGAVANGTDPDVLEATAFDDQNKPLEGIEFVITTEDSDLNLGTATIVTGADGKGILNVTSTVATEHVANATYNGQVVAESPLKLHYVAGPVDPDKTHLTVDPARQVAGSPVDVTVSVRDAFDNPVTGLTRGDFVLSGDAASAIPDLADADFAQTAPTGGDYVFKTTSKFAGSFTLHAVVTDVQIKDAPTVVFTAGEVCVSKCDPEDNPDTDEDESQTHRTSIVMTKNDQPADGQSKDEAQGSAYDHYGNAVEGAVFTVTDASTGDLAGRLTPQTVTTDGTNADGKVAMGWSSAKAGTFTANAKVRSGEMTEDVEVPIATKDGLNAIRFSVGDISAERSELTIEPKEDQVVGSSFTATAKIVDATGNPLEKVTVSFYTSEPEVALVDDDTCQTGADGTCSIHVSSKLVGDYDVHATVPIKGVATDLGGNGVAAKASPQTVTFVPDKVCTENCTPIDDPRTPEDESKSNLTKVTVDPNDAQDNGVDKDVLNVFAYDRYGNGVPDAKAIVNAPADVTMPVTTATTNQDGLVNFNATSTKAGSYMADVTVDGLTPKYSPAELRFTHGPVGEVTLALNPASGQEVGENYEVTATVKDATGNLLPDATVSFTLPDDVTMVGAVDGAEATCQTNASGVCVITITSEKVGEYPIDGRVGGAVSDPVTAEFLVGPVDGAMSTVEVTRNGARFDGEDQDIATVTARDRFGNPVPGATVTSTGVEGKADALMIQSDVAATGADGKTTIWYTSTTAGEKLADVRINQTVTPTGSPAKLLFGNVGDPAHSQWTITPTTPLVVGTTNASAFTLTATIRDTQDKPVYGAVVSFGVDKDTTAWGATDQSCVTDASGVCSVTVTSTAAGTFAFTATLSNGPIGEAKGAIWTPDVVCGPCSLAEVVTDNEMADGVAHDVVKVTARDKYDNAVPGQNVVTTPGDDTLVAQTGVRPTDDNGETTIWYSSKKAGEHTATIAIGAASVTPEGSPVKLHFRAGPVDPGQSSLAVDATTKTIDQPVTATLTARDANGNLVPDVTASFTLDKETGTYLVDSATFLGDSAETATVAATGTASCVTGADGTCSVQFTDPEAESVDVHGLVKTADDATVEVSDSPQTVAFTAGCVPRIDEDCQETPNPPVPNDRRTQVEVTVDDQLSDGEQADVAQARVFDYQGNPTTRVITTDSTDAALEIGAIKPVSEGVSDIEYRTATGADETFTAKVYAAGQEIVFIPQPGSDLNNADAVARLSSPVDLHFKSVTAPDTTPDAPVITGPKDGSLTNNRPVPVTGTGESGNDITVVDKDGKEVCTTTVKPDGTWTCEASLEDGEHTLTATQTDPDGDESEPSAPVKVTVDTTAPDAPIIDNANDSEISGSVPGDLDEGTTVTVTYPTKDGNKQVTVPVGPDGRWTVKPTPDDAIDGEIIAVATDPAKNVSKPTTGDLDVTAPEPPTIDVANRDEIGGKAEPGSTVKVTLPDGTQLCEVKADKDGNWSCLTPDTVTKDTKIIATATDDAGNTSGPTEGWLDVTAPESPIANPSNGSEIGGSAEPGSQVKITDETGKTIPGCENVTADTNGRFTCTPTTPVEPGTKVEVVAVDKAGNASKPTTVVIVGLAIDVKPANPKRGDTQVVTGTNFNPGERVCLTLDSAVFDPGCRNADATGKVTFTYTVPENFELGEHTATLTGEKSGSVSMKFTVVETVKVQTGGEIANSGALNLRALVAGLMVATLGVWVGATRRKGSGARS
ncbi:MAG: Ig-like domain-containing protein [Propionibacteriaceae bacterium]|jgi:adhesin/invasin|nr:Ig-like domain-containing protein [Propionibacteriaceae bacterium]